MWGFKFWIILIFQYTNLNNFVMAIFLSVSLTNLATLPGEYIC
jgi:hypothetical protein